MILKNHITLFLRVQQSRGGLAKLFEGTFPNCLWISKKFIHVPMGIFKRKIRSMNLSRRIALIPVRIIIYNKGLTEEWDKKKCFNQLELLLLRIWREDCKTFCRMSSLYGFLLPKRGPIGSETSVRNDYYSLCSSPEERISEGSIILWNTRSYRPNDTMSRPRILEFSSSPLWEPNLSYFIFIFIIFFV